MINNLITHLKEEASEDAEHKGFRNTELTTNTQTRKEKTTIVEKLHVTVDELDASMEKLAMKVAKTLRPEVSSSRQRSFRQSEEIDPRTVLEASAGSTAEIFQKG